MEKTTRSVGGSRGICYYRNYCYNNIIVFVLELLVGREGGTLYDRVPTLITNDQHVLYYLIKSNLYDTHYVNTLNHDCSVKKNRTRFKYTIYIYTHFFIVLGNYWSL